MKKMTEDNKLCHICLKDKVTKEYDKLDLCDECLHNIQELIQEGVAE